MISRYVNVATEDVAAESAAASALCSGHRHILGGSVRPMHRAARRIDLAAADSSEASRLRAGPAHSGPSHALTASRGQTPEQPTPRALIPASFAASRSRPAPFRQQRAPVHIVKPSEGASAAEAARQKPTIMQKRISHDFHTAAFTTDTHGQRCMKNTAACTAVPWSMVSLW